jgi:glycosyltransferase involved in cell wall biosynthesis
MTRIGMNPARGRVSDYTPARVTVVVLVYVPYQSAYFAHRFDVVRLCLASIIKNTQTPYDLFVFDNGSCDEVKHYLHDLLEAGSIQYLLSAGENIGKIGAFKVAFEAAPGEVIAFCDDDIFHYPGWLATHLEILDGFPKVGMVSGCALRTLYDHGISSNLALAESDPEVTLITGQNIPEKWEVEWAESYGRDVEKHINAIREMPDYQLERNGLRAFAVANHNQFVAQRDVITKFLPSTWSSRLMGQMNELDIDVDAGGYLRLSTVQRTTQHMGNIVSPRMVEEAASMGITVSASKVESPLDSGMSLMRRLLRWPLARRILLGIYNRLFWLISDQRGDWLDTK